MKNIKKAEMELIGTGFSKKIIMDRQTSLRLFTTNFSPIISAKRIILHRRWLELIYAMPYVVLRREMSNSFTITKNMLTSPAKQIWNIFVRLEFPPGRYEYLCIYSEREAPAGIKEESPVTTYQLPIITHHPSAVSHDPSVAIYNKYDYLKHAPSLIRKTVSVEQREMPSTLRESEIAHHHHEYLERETPEIVQTRVRNLKPSSMKTAAPVSHERSTAGIGAKEESAVTNYQLPIITHHPPAVSHDPSVTIYKNVEQREMPSTLRESEIAHHHYGYLKRETPEIVQTAVRHLKPSSMKPAAPVSHERSTAGIEAKEESVVTNYQLPIITHHPPTISHDPSVTIYKNAEKREMPSTLRESETFYHHYEYLKRETPEIVQTTVRHLKPSPMKPATPLHGRSAVTNYQLPIITHHPPAISHERSTAGIEAKEESAVTNYQLPIITHHPPAVSHDPSVTIYNKYDSLKHAPSLIRKTVSVDQREMPSTLRESEIAHHHYEYLGRETPEIVQTRVRHLKLSSMKTATPLHERSAVTNYQLPIITHHPPAVNRDPSVTIYKNVEQREMPSALRESETFYHHYEYLKRETPEIVQTRVRHLKPSSMKPATPLHERSTAGIEAKEESAVTNYQLPIITHHPPAISHKSARAHTMNRSFSLPRTKEVQLDTPWMKKVPIYHTYPKMEHLASTNAEIVKEKIMEKEIDSKPQHLPPQPPGIDVNRLADQIYQLIERRVRIERERRGL